MLNGISRVCVISNHDELLVNKYVHIHKRWIYSYHRNESVHCIFDTWLDGYIERTMDNILIPQVSMCCRNMGDIIQTKRSHRGKRFR